MFIKNLPIKIWMNREKIIILCCFWSVLCFNILNVLAAVYSLFTYDGGSSDTKTYYEIKTVIMAQKTFQKNIFEHLFYGLFFYLPLIWSYYFTKHINLNAILIQLLPFLIVLGFALFGI